MASETPLKRQREETLVVVEQQEQEQENTKIEKDAHEESQETKRHKSSYNHILTLLDDEEEEEEPAQQHQDISSLITTLQQELSSENSPDALDQENILDSTIEDCACDSSSSKEDEEDDKERVMRHLLEASDDELGLPNSTEQFSLDSSSNLQELFDVNGNAADGYPFGDGLWEFEDEAANYYTMLHSELFL